MNAANICQGLKYSLFREVFQHAADINNDKEATRYKHAQIDIAKWVRHMKFVGEAGIVKLKSASKTKLKIEE